MEPTTEQLIQKLVMVLRRMARTARNSQWMGMTDEADQYSIDQFNRILERLKAVDTSGVHDVFAPLPQHSSWSSLASACKDLIACYDTESGSERPASDWNGFWTDARSGIWIDKKAFKCGLPPEMNEFGDFLREKIGEWQQRSRRKPEER